MSTEPSGMAGLFLWLGPLIAVILWLQKDARRTGVASVHDWGYFLWFAWPVVIPWYAWKTRGVAGWRLALGLFALILSASLASFLVNWVRWLAAWAIYGIQYALWYFRVGA